MKATVHKCEWITEGLLARVDDYEIDLPKAVDARLKVLQDLVGGKIDIYNHEGNDLVINDEGLLMDLPINPWGTNEGMTLAGNIVEVHGRLP